MTEVWETLKEATQEGHYDHVNISLVICVTDWKSWNEKGQNKSLTKTETGIHVSPPSKRI